MAHYEEQVYAHRIHKQCSVASSHGANPSVRMPLLDDVACNRRQHAIWKALYMVHKFPNHESAVDAFVQLLLREIGFNDGWSHVFPQLRLSLTYGEKPNSVEKDAIADFTIMDVVSFFSYERI